MGRHLRQLDKLTELLLSRAWAAGAGPGDAPMTIDVDSTVCEAHGYAKQGAAYGYTWVLGHHPVLATRADTDEVLHTRIRAGSANTARGAQRLLRETFGRVRRAGAAGPLTLRADSGFWSNKVIVACADHDVRYFHDRARHYVRRGCHRADPRRRLGGHRLQRPRRGAGRRDHCGAAA